MPVAPPSHDLLVHVRTVISIILGLSIARLLNGVANLVQHPKKEHLWWPHLCWAAYMLVSITAFWWWEFQLNQLRVLTFETYIFPHRLHRGAIPALQPDLPDRNQRI
jgi:hypothetical protein